MSAAGLVLALTLWNPRATRPPAARQQTAASTVSVPRGAPSSDVVKNVLKVHMKYDAATSSKSLTDGFDTAEFERKFADMERGMEIVYGDRMVTVGDTNLFMTLEFQERMTDQMTGTDTDGASLLDTMNIWRRVPANTKIYPVKIIVRKSDGKTSTYRLRFCQAADGEWLFRVGD
ncbi:MAG: hypothetical protein LBD30_02020 [Verrucomicrobiales bacterium]|nr:hypothetical protein [Verrucomicrobiales bacterium]